MRTIQSMVRAACVTLVACGVWTSPAAVAQDVASGCPADDSGLKLPQGFCATVFADDIGHARHLVVAANGVVYVNTWSGRYYANAAPPSGGFLVALKDTQHTGRADVTQRFGESIQSGGAGGTGIGIFKKGLYAEIDDRIVRYPLAADSVAPDALPTTVVSGLPLEGDHPMHPFLIDSNGSMYIDVATASNSCQVKSRAVESPGVDPCVELLTRGGIWRYDAAKTGQVFSPANRYATGIRNAEGFASDSQRRIFVSQHGRDQLHTNWPKLYQEDQEATLPAEEVLLLKKGGDYGWPTCYFDPAQKKLVLAPEYGGDGGSKVGVCGKKTAPVAYYPPHWAPNAMTFYDNKAFPERYRSGVFIAFHGSWNRAPFEQQGYNVVYQPLVNGKAAGRCEIFAEGFAGKIKSPGKAEHRPSGLAVGPDGALYVSDDVRGRIYRITYRAGANPFGESTPCPDPAAAAGPVSANVEKPPVDDDTALPVPPGASKEMVALGDQVFHGAVGGAACTGCHGADGAGTPLGPNLADSEWLWSDGSPAGIAATITSGVMQPKKFRAGMPPLGGAQLSPDQVQALAAYVWGLSHHGGT